MRSSGSRLLALCRAGGAQALSSSIYLACARADARADESADGTCGPLRRPQTGGAADGFLRANSWGVGVISVQPGSGPTVLRILLGSQLRRLREARGITREDAGYAIRASGSKISRMELGRVSFKERDVVDLLEIYGVTDEAERATLVALAREANSPGWWHKYGDVLPGLVPGLCRPGGGRGSHPALRGPVRPWAAADGGLRPGGRPAGSAGQLLPAEIERRVSLRIARQELLSKPDAPRLWAVVDEAALRRPIGGREVMRAQLERLIEVTKEPNVTLQVVPFSSGGHAAEGGAFTILRFPELDLPDVVYVEQLTSCPLPGQARRRGTLHRGDGTPQRRERVAGTHHGNPERDA